MLAFKLYVKTMLKEIERSIKQIEPERWYKVSSILENGWIVNTKGKPNAHHVHRLIKLGKLLARDVGTGSKNPFYMIRGQEIIDYLRKTYL